VVDSSKADRPQIILLHGISSSLGICGHKPSIFVMLGPNFRGWSGRGNADRGEHLDVLRGL